MKNKINGFIIAIHDKLVDMKPRLCGKGGANESGGGRETDMSRPRSNVPHNQERVTTIDFVHND